MTEALLFYPLGALALVGAVAVVLLRNPLHGAMSLVASFFFLAGIYLLLGAQLLAALQILVYAGAVMVLFLFVIMLLSLSEADLGKRIISPFRIFGALGAAAIAGLAVSLAKGKPAALAQLPADFGSVAAVGRLLYTGYLPQFEALSVLLLVAIVGAVVVAKGRI